MRAQVLKAYKQLLKATKIQFPAEESMRVIYAMEIRSEFEDNRHVTSQSEIQKLLQKADSAYFYLTTMRLQARRNQHGVFVAKPGVDDAGGTRELLSEEMLKRPSNQPLRA